MNNKLEVLIEKYIGNKQIYRIPVGKRKYMETIILPEQRNLDNIPKYTNESNKIEYKNGLELKKEPELWPKLRNTEGGGAENGCCYGYGKRSIEEFYKGKKIRRDSIGNDTKKEFTIETHEQAEEFAKKFAREIS